jgi:chorismate--pyruvate lyase
MTDAGGGAGGDAGGKTGRGPGGTAGEALHAANWRPHLGRGHAGAALRQWLTADGSLTARLMAHSTQFRVQRLHQRRSPCLRDEAALIGLPRQRQVWEREVLLLCDQRPMIFAHTVVPLSATSSDWPLFGGLGERSLGSTLFGDPRVVRGALQFARLAPSHPLAQRARAAVGREFGCGDGHDGALLARRCLYRRRQGLLLVTEVFLPGIEALNLQRQNSSQK